jgi:hypothetical protein
VDSASTKAAPGPDIGRNHPSVNNGFFLKNQASTMVGFITIQPTLSFCLNIPNQNIGSHGF